MNGFTNDEEMFAQSIGLTEPWYIDRAEFNETSHEVHIYVKARKTSKYPCYECGELCERYDDEEDERVWRHGGVVFFPRYVHCRRLRTKCKKYGIHVVEAPWARKGSRYTLLFESYAMLLNAVKATLQSLATLYRTLESYKCMIYLVAGKLSLDCPPLFA